MNKSIEKKLSLLIKLQNVDSKLDSIERLKGELPQEVSDLEDGLVGLKTRLQRINTEISDIQEEVVKQKADSLKADQLVRKYEEQHKTIRNNREFDAITKEIELQKLEVKLFDKKIKTNTALIKEKKTLLQETESLVKHQEIDIKNKKKELEEIIKENEAKEEKLTKSREKIKSQINDPLLGSYERLRENMRNKLAVVPIRRGACGGCFNIVTPQRHVDIRAQNKIIACEHCGRIFSGAEDVETVDTTKKKVVKKA